MAGLAERRGASADTFLDLARDDVPPRAGDDSRRRRGDRRSGLCRDAGGGLRRGRGVPLPAPRRERRALRRRRGDGAADRARGRGDRHRSHAVAGVLRPLEFRRRAAAAGAAAVHQRSAISYARLVGRCREAIGETSRRRRRAALASRGDAGRTRRRHSARRRRRPFTSTSPSSQAEVEACLAWSGARPVRWLLDHADVDERWCLIHATHMDQQRNAIACALRRRRRPLPDHRGQPRRRRVSHARVPRRGRTVRRRRQLECRDRPRR